jgi:hypothetical protein
MGDSPTPAIKDCVVRNNSRACGKRTAVKSMFNPSELKLFQFNARSSIGPNFNFLMLGYKKTQKSLLLNVRIHADGRLGRHRNH